MYPARPGAAALAGALVLALLAVTVVPVTAGLPEARADGGAPPSTDRLPHAATVPDDPRPDATAENETATASPTPTETPTSTPTDTPTPTTTDTPTSTPTDTPTPTPTPTDTPTPTPTSTDAGTPTPTATAAATLVVSNLTAPPQVRRGDPYTVAATVTNRADGRGTGTVTYTVAGRAVAAETVTLDADASTRVTFEADLAAAEGPNRTLDPGSYVHGVRNATGEGVPRHVRVTPDVDVRVTGFDAPASAPRGEPFLVLATVENPADVTLTRTLAYTFDGRVVAERTVTVAGGEAAQVAFEVRVADVEAVGGDVRDGTTHDHAVRAPGGGRDGSAVRVVRGPSADPDTLAVEGFDAPDAVRPGDSFAVNLTVRNVGTAAFEGQVAYRLDGAVVATEWLAVPTGERRTATFRLDYAAVERAAVPLSARETDHGVRVGNRSLVTRPVTVDAAVATPTPEPTPQPTFEGTATPDATRGEATPTATPAGSGGDGSTCRRGFVTRCGGTPMDETTLTIVGTITSVLGILYEMLKSN